MKLLASTAVLLSAASAKSISNNQLSRPQHVFSNPPVDNDGFKIPSIRESAAMARKIMHLSSIGDLVTVFPDPTSSSNISNSSPEAQEQRPTDVAGSPIGLLEYYADCDPESSGNPILLAIDIATPYRNYNQGSNISLSIRWWPIEKNTYLPWTSSDEDNNNEIPTPRTPAALPRFSLHGRLEPVPESPAAAYAAIQSCFLRAHPDSIYWQPGNDVSHASRYVRLVVEQVYWFGGFGDRARIGWLPVEEWRDVTKEEIGRAELPGESRSRGRGRKEGRLLGGWWR